MIYIYTHISYEIPPGGTEHFVFLCVCEKSKDLDLMLCVFSIFLLRFEIMFNSRIILIHVYSHTFV